MNADAIPVADAPRRSRWWLDSGIARLAFGTRADPAVATGSTIHLAFLPIDALELDLSDPLQREFGDYELLEQVGQGGMGVVYRARQRSLDREVALKLLAAGPWASEEFIAGFRREARSAAALQHPNIVAVHEMGERDGLIYYSMQLVQGCSLAQRLRDGPLRAREAAAMLRTVAEAIDYAHRLGVLHLDLKPGNILLDAAGTAMVADFGLARRLGQAPSLENEQISGTPSYMAPEQARVRSTRLSPATDIWGLGAILYETLTGTPPFIADTPQAVLQLVLEGTVRRPARHVRVPADLEAICLRCLSKSPDARYASARELADDLGRFLENRAVAARPLNLAQRASRWARREPKLAAASAVSVLLLAGGLAATTAQWQRAENNAATASARLWDGRRAAALGLEADGLGWQAAPLLLQNARELEQAGRPGEALLDRRRLGLLLGQGATLVDSMLVADARPLAVALSADGSRLALALGDRSVRWYDTATLTEQGRIALDGIESADGLPRSITWLAFHGTDRLDATMEWYRHFANPDSGDTWKVDLEAGTARAAASGFAGLPWLLSPDGRRAITLDAGMRELHVHDWPGRQLLRTLSFPPDTAISAWAFQPGGRLVALGDAEGRVFLYDPGNGRLRLLPSARGLDVGWLGFSDDGTWLASGGMDGRVHVFDVASGDALASHTMEHAFPIRRLGLDRARRLLLVAGDGRAALWRLPIADGPRAGSPIRIALAPAPHALAGPYAIDWSPRTGLLASAGLDGQVRLWRLPPSPTLATRQAPQLPERAQFDGQRLVDVEWNRVRITDLRGVPASPELELAQPPGFAELVGGKVLALTVGAQLQLRDTQSLRLRAPPLDLPGSPSRLLATPDGHRLLLAFADRGDDGFSERLVLYDIDSGRPLPGEARVPGALLALVFSPGGDRLLAIGPADDATRLFASTDSLRLIHSYVHDPLQPVVAGAFAPDPRQAWLLSRSPEPTAAGDALVVWQDGNELARLPTGGARPYGIVASGAVAFLPGEVEHLRFDGVALHPVARSESTLDGDMGAYAASADGKLFAIATLRSIQLYSSDGATIGAPLRIDTDTTDGIALLAFAADGSRLLARTIWTAAQWRVAPEPRSDAQLDTLFANLTQTGDHALVALPSRAWRHALRRRDPGAWPQPARLPPPAAAGHALLDGAPIPARAPGTPARLLDLGKVYVVAPGSVRNSSKSQRPFLRPNPGGLQHLLDSDYDIRGIAEAGTHGLGACIATPDAMPVAAIRALVLPTVPAATTSEQTVADLVFRYRDGGEASVPLRTTREVQGFGGNDHEVPQVFPVSVMRAAMGLGATTLAAPRLANPDPGRAVACVDLRSRGETVLVLALTADAPGELVTSAADSR